MNLFLSVLNRLCVRIEPKGRASRPKPQGLLLELSSFRELASFSPMESRKGKATL